MRLSNQRGQGLMLAIMCLGVIMAGVIIFGYDKSKSVNNLIDRLDMSQAAFEALNAAAKRVQNVYSSESGCDPRTLNSRLSAMPELPASAASLGTGTNSTYAVAQPSSSGAARFNRCDSSSNTGCRQIAIPIDNIYYIVTVGAISRDDVKSATGRASTDCPRDASVRLSVAVNGNVYFQRFTLTNLCTLASCNCITGDCSAAEAAFNNLSITSSASMSSSACTGLATGVPARKYGSFINSTSTLITTGDLRWARVYLDTGGGGSGDTTYIYAPGATNYSEDVFTVTNAACTPNLSASQCKSQPCFPALDLNRDGSNNEVDIAILEHYLRGYLTSLPVNELN